MKTQKCKFGIRCKFNHPNEKLNGSANEVFLGVSNILFILILLKILLIQVYSSLILLAAFLFSHGNLAKLQGAETTDILTLPERPTEPVCSVSCFICNLL